MTSDIRKNHKGGAECRVVDKFSQFDLEPDFAGKQASHDLLVTISREIPIWPVFGESARPFFDNDLNNVERS